MNGIVGIDLGTTFSAIASIDEYGQPYLIRNHQMESMVPSVISFKDGDFIFGNEAKEDQELGEEDIAAFFKRNMGDQGFVLQFGGQEYSAEDLSALLLEHLKKEAESQIGQKIEKAVITVPAYFTNTQRNATVKAGEKAGLEVLRIINEPTSAAIAYGLDMSREQTLLIYDLGGGTFDVTLIEYTPEGMVVLATDGDHELGGKNWDDRIVNDASSKFQEAYGEDPLVDSLIFNELLVFAERAKKQLSTREKTNLSFSHNGNKLKYELTRSQFEDMSQDLMERTQLLAESVLKEKDMSWADLDGVLLVGGSTRMPQVKTWVESMSGRPVVTGVNVDEAVALGAAIVAQKECAKSISPDLQLPARTNFTDVMSHSLGMVVESEDRSCYRNCVIIPKNVEIPCHELRPLKLRTTGGNSELEVYMTQGESDRPLDNEIIGLYHFSGIDKEQGEDEAILDVGYHYDKNGIIQIEATQKGTGKQLDLEIKEVPLDLSWMDEPPQDLINETFEHLSVVFAIDLSGSMSGGPLKKAKQATRDFIKNMDLTNSSIGLLSFADSVHTDLDLSQNFRKLDKAIMHWSVGSVGYGNDAEPFVKAGKILEKVDGYRIIVVLTDGVWSYQSAAIREAVKCHAQGIDVVAVGFGHADKKFLKSIASTDEGALFVDLRNLSTQLSKIGQALTQSGGINMLT